MFGNIHDPEGYITIAPHPGRVVVRVAGHVVADTRAALVLREGASWPVAYIPRQDVDMAQLQRTERVTHCPFKGDCSYFSIPAGGERAVNAVWSYEAPFDAVAAIKDHLAFYASRVDAIEDLPAA